MLATSSVQEPPERLLTRIRPRDADSRARGDPEKQTGDPLPGGGLLIDVLFG